MVTWDTVVLSYTSGLLAALSPCVIVLVPLLLFRFLPDKRASTSPVLKSSAASGVASPLSLSSSLPAVLVSPSGGGGSSSGLSGSPTAATLRQTGAGAAAPHAAIAIFALGFQCSYLIFGYFLSSLLTSRIQHGFKIGLGCLFVMLAALSATSRFDPLHLPLFKNTFFMGGSFALLISFNPCTVPFLAVIISLNTTDALIALLCFAQGLLTPALFAVYLGRGCINVVKKRGQFMAMLNKGMSGMLGIMGAYLILATPLLNTADLVVSCIMSMGTMVLVLKSFSLIDLGASSIHKAFSYHARVVIAGFLVLLFALFAICSTASHNPVTHAAIGMDQVLIPSSQTRNESMLSSDVLRIPVDSTPLIVNTQIDPSSITTIATPTVTIGVDASLASPTLPTAAPVTYSYRKLRTKTMSASPSPPLAGHESNQGQAVPAAGGGAGGGGGGHVVGADDAEMKCVDLSKVLPCSPCVWCVRAHLVLALTVAALVMGYDYLEAQKNALP